jgi:protein subunit release factor A
MDIRDVRFDTLTTSSAVKATHIPTGKTVTINATISMFKNRKLALEALEKATNALTSEERKD